MLFLLPVGIFLLDRLVKAWAQRSLSAVPGGIQLLPGVINLTYAQNSGMAFGFLSGQRWLLVLLSLAAVIAVVFSLRPYRLGLWAKLSLLSILGGMAGNLTDRIFMGFVVDMFDFSFVRFAIFNVADMFISFGAVFLCISLLFRPDDWRRKGEKAQAS
jgi:signal peptidase II